MTRPAYFPRRRWHPLAARAFDLERARACGPAPVLVEAALGCDDAKLLFAIHEADRAGLPADVRQYLGLTVPGALPSGIVKRARELWPPKKETP